jgi:hypothetical protein
VNLKQNQKTQARWCTPIIPALRQEYHKELEVSLGYTVRHCLKGRKNMDWKFTHAKSRAPKRFPRENTKAAPNFWREVLLTQGDQVPVVLQHPISVQILLSLVQAFPLLLR